MDGQLRRGLLEVCVLAAMRRGDSYGYRLIKDISPYIDISESTLYPILRRLEGAQLVTVYSMAHNGRLRKYYRITEAGRARIASFLEEWQDVLRAYRFIQAGDGSDEQGNIPDKTD